MTPLSQKVARLSSSIVLISLYWQSVAVGGRALLFGMVLNNDLDVRHLEGTAARTPGLGVGVNDSDCPWKCAMCGGCVH